MATKTVVGYTTYWAPRCVAVFAGVWALNKLLRFSQKKVLPAVFPSVMQKFMIYYNQKMDGFKRQLFFDLPDFKQKYCGGQLTVLEVGVGTGANFKYYPEGTSLIALEPNKNFNTYLESNAKEFPNVKVEKFVVAFGENMKDIPDESVDVVVCTLVLCSVRSVDRVIKEIRRVLKPGGKFYYMEHVHDWTDKSWTQTIQRIINPVWTIFTDGCSVMKTTWKNIDEGGFSKVEYKTFMAPLSRVAFMVSPHVMGYAVK
ncbi:thiol S-methyltransferase TMT1A-like [Glandiceps talaboti]